MTRGKFITLEGPDGAGKTTLAHYLSSWLAKQGIANIKTYEPGGTDSAEALRHLVLHPPFAHQWDPLAEFMILAAARCEHVQKVILPSLDKNMWVICDRFFDSSIAYQGYGKNVPLDFIDTCHEFILKNCQPDMTFFLDIPPAISLQRKHGQDINAFDTLDLAVHEKIYQGFKAQAAKFPERCRILDAQEPTELLLAKVADHLQIFLQQ